MFSHLSSRPPVRRFARIVALAITTVPAAIRAAEPESLKVGPQILKANEHGVGRLVPALAAADLNGRAMRIGEQDSAVALVLAFFSTTCPISNKLGPELARLERDCAARGIAVWLVNAAPADTDAELAGFAAKFALKAPIVPDRDGAVGRALGLASTTEIFVIDRRRTLVYRGAINDRYGLGYARDTATRNYAREAIDAVSAGRPPEIGATSAPGCAVELRAGDGPATPITYYNQISRTIQSHCVECHHTGGLGPFSLESYEQVVKNAAMIRRQVARGAMPPWFATRIDPHGESPWINDRSLSDAEKSELLSWLDSDRPKGDPADAPLPRVFTNDWAIGEPDAILQLKEPVAVKAEGTMPYQYRVVETSFSDERWVQAYEIRPTVPAVVHHVIVSVHGRDEILSRQGDEGAQGFWAAYVPGNSHRIYPAGYARRLPAGAKVLFQIHYTPNGTAVDEQLRIGLLFAKEPPRHEVFALGIPQPRLRIPPGAASHVETARYRLPANVTVTALQAHAHLRGKAFKFELLRDDAAPETLLDLPRYDFNWQLQYNYAQPRALPAGATLKVTAMFDNSAQNPANPDPTKEVRWGQQTFQEMMIGYVEYCQSVGAEPLAPPLRRRAQPRPN